MRIGSGAALKGKIKFRKSHHHEMTKKRHKPVIGEGLFFFNYKRMPLLNRRRQVEGFIDFPLFFVIAIFSVKSIALSGLHCEELALIV